MPPFRERFLSTVWVVLLDSNLQTEKIFSEAGELNYLAVEYLLRCIFPHKTIRASLECTNQSREAPVSIVREC